MNRLTRTAVGLFAAAAVIAPINAAPSANAAPARDWTTMENLHNAKHQTCKVSVQDGTVWRVFNRVNARNLETGRVKALFEAHGPEGQVRRWESGWVRHGTVSEVGAFNVPKAWHAGLVSFLFRGETSEGGDVPGGFAAIGRC